MPRGGRRSTTWGSSWNLGKTKLIRVPIAIADEVIKNARKIDDERKIVPSPISNKSDDFCLVTDKNNDDLALLQAKNEAAIALLKESLALKANAGGKIKVKVREAIELLT